jgi:acetylornithine deacetylase
VARDLTPELVEQVSAAVAAGIHEQVEFTRDLIRYPSLRGAEREAQAFYAEALRSRGYNVERFTIDVPSIEQHPGFSPVTVSYDNAVNVVGRREPPTAVGRTLILNGHMDVVPTGPEDRWTHPPFAAHVEGDWIYGRGGGDMKAGLTANVFAVEALVGLGYAPGAAVIQQSVVEEESTGNGTLACHIRGYEADAAVIPEPEDERLVRANVGVLWFEIVVEGNPVHVREAGSGANAIEAAYKVISALRELEHRLNDERADHEYFADVERPIVFNPGVIAGGDWPSSVASRCKIDARFSLYPLVDPADAMREIERTVAQAADADAYMRAHPPRIRPTGFRAAGYTLEAGSKAERALAWAHHSATGEHLETIVTPGYLDARVFALYAGTPALTYGPIAENIHGVDERVSIKSMQRVTTTVALFVAAWCGIVPI